MQTIATEPYRIRCAEIWGGITLANSEVCTRGLTASIFSQACGDTKGGDIYYFSVCSADKLTRIALADLRGHGAAASRFSATLYESLQRRMNTLDGGGVLAELNEETRKLGFDALTTAAVLGYYTANSRLYFSYAGHPPVLIQTSGNDWRPLELRGESTRANLPLGVFSGTRYDQCEITLQPGDRFFVYTDGVLECPNPDGEEFGLDRLRETLSAAGLVDVAEMKQAVASALLNHAGGELTHDDCTFMVVEVTA